MPQAVTMGTIHVHRNMLRDFFVAGGYTILKTTSMMGRPIMLEVSRPPGENEFGSETFTLFEINGYPDQARGECFFNCWNWMGSGSKVFAEKLSAGLNAIGCKARVTKKKGDIGVAFVPNYDIFEDLAKGEIT